MAEVADDLAAIRAHNQQRGPRCQSGIALNAMDPALRDTVQRAAADPTIEHAAIVRWLKATHGIILSVDSFRRHMNGECRCG